MSTPSDKTLRLERTKLTPQPPRGGRNSTLIVAVVAGIAAAVLTGIWLNSKSQPTAQAPVVQPAAPPVTTPVVVATKDIPAQTVITADMVSPSQVTPDKLKSGAVVNTADILGKATMAPMNKGDQILAINIGPNIGPFTGVAGMLKPGQRAMTIALDPTSSVAGFLKPGDHVDVIGTFTVNARTITRTVLQNVELLATGAEVEQKQALPASATTDNSNSSDANGPQPQPAAPREIPNATVVVTQLDAEKLIMAVAKGRLMLTLRSNTDFAQSVVPMVDESAVTSIKSNAGGSAAPPPPPPAPPLPTMKAAMPVAPPPPLSVIVIRGSNSQTVNVPT